MKKCTASILVALCAILLMSCLLPGDSGKPQPPQKTIKANAVFLGEWTRSDNGMTVDIRETVVLMDNRTFEYSSSSSTTLAFSGNTITKTPQEGVLLLNNTIRLYKMIQPEIPVECTETLTVSSSTPLTGIILYPNGDHTWFSNSWSESVPMPAFLQYEIHLFNSAASDPVDYVMTVKAMMRNLFPAPLTVLLQP